MTLTRQQLKQIELIRVCPQKLRKNLLKKLPNTAHKAISECALNVLKGNIPLSTHQKKCLKKHKTILRKIGDKKTTLFKKKKLIIQQGGFLNILIPAVAALLPSIINGVV